MNSIITKIEQSNSLFENKWKLKKFDERNALSLSQKFELSLIVAKLLSIRDIKDDKYFYNSDEQSLIGKNTKKKYQLGDPLQIEVKKADLIKKHLDFTII